MHSWGSILIMLRVRPCRVCELGGKSRARAAAIAMQNPRKQPIGAACAGRIAFRIMYIMLTTDWASTPLPSQANGTPGIPRSPTPAIAPLHPWSPAPRDIPPHPCDTRHSSGAPSRTNVQIPREPQALNPVEFNARQPHNHRDASR